MKKFKFIVVVLTMIVAGSTPLMVMAFDSLPAVGGVMPTSFRGCNAASPTSCFVTQVIGLLLEILGSLAILFVIFSGFKYMTSAGNEQAAEKAKKSLTNAVVGFIIILMAYVILAFVQRVVTAGA